MSRRIAAELLKLRTTRTTIGLVLGMLVLVLFAVVVQLIVADTSSASSSAPHLDNPDDQRTLFTSASSAGLFAVLLGVLAVTNEFRHGTIRPTLLFAPGRASLVVAKSIACAAAGALIGIAAVVVGFGVTLAWLRFDGVARLVDDRDLVAIGAGCVAATLLWAAIGVGFGATVRNQVGAIVGTIVWSFIPEPLLQGLVPKVGRFTPGSASDALSGATGSHHLPPLSALGVMAGWAVLFIVVGAVLTTHRDVP